MKKDLLGIDDLSPDEIYLILETAEAMREIGERPIKKVPTLRGKTVVNLFYEPSTRTRTSFVIAEKRLSADTLNIDVETRSALKRAQGGDARRHGAEHRSHGARHDRAASRFVGRVPPAVQALPIQDHQRRRWHARASDAGPARRLYDPPAQIDHRKSEGRDRR